jgi:hypothetical protein
MTAAARALDRWHSDRISAVTGALVALAVRCASLDLMLHYLEPFRRVGGCVVVGAARCGAQPTTQNPITHPVVVRVALRACVAHAAGFHRNATTSCHVRSCSRLAHHSLVLVLVSSGVRLGACHAWLPGGLERHLLVLACSLCSLVRRSFAPSFVRAHSSFTGARVFGRCRFVVSFGAPHRISSGGLRVEVGLSRAARTFNSAACPTAAGRRSSIALVGVGGRARPAPVVPCIFRRGRRFLCVA